MELLRDQHGGSIIEVVVMSAVMVAMMTGFMSLISHESKNITYLEDKLSRVALESELRMFFASEDTCKKIFTGFVVPRTGQTKDVSRLIASTAQAKVLANVFQKRGNDFFYDKLALKKMDLENSTFASAGTSGTVDLMFYPERTRKGGGPDSLQPIKLKTSLTVDGSYKVTSCSAEEESGKSCLTSDLNKLYIVPRGKHTTGSSSLGRGHDNGSVECEQTMYLYLSSRKPSVTEAKVRHGIIAFVYAQWDGTGYVCGTAARSYRASFRSQIDLQAQCDNGGWKWIGGSAYTTPGTPELPGSCTSGYCH